MGDDYKLTEKGEAAVQEICGAVRELVGSRPEGFPAGHLYAALMPITKTLTGFENLMAVSVKLGFVEKRGQLYFTKGD